MSLCFVQGFDLKNDSKKCPKERNALKEFHDAAKGREWTDDGNWSLNYVHHCDWLGVECDDTKSTVLKLVLPHNGLSGKLSSSIGDLGSLEKLDLGDNDIKVSRLVHILFNVLYSASVLILPHIVILHFFCLPGFHSK